MPETSDKTDEDLLVLLAQDEIGAFDEFYKRHCEKVFSYLMKKAPHFKAGSKRKAEDLVQIVFMQVFKKRAQYSPKFSAMQWLFVISKSELRDYNRRESRHFLVSQNLTPQEFDNMLSQSSVQTPKEHCEANCTEHSIDEILAVLSESEKNLLEQRYLQEKTFREIAEVLDKTEINVRKIISRTLHKARLVYEQRSFGSKKIRQ